MNQTIHGFCRESLGSIDDAIEYYIKALNIDSNYLMAYQRVTQLLLGKNRTLEAICYIYRGLTIDPDNFFY